MKIIIIHIDLLADTEKHFGDLTDQEVLDLCAQDKDMKNHSVYDSVEQFAADFNTDEMFDSHNAYMRVIQEQGEGEYSTYQVFSEGENGTLTVDNVDTLKEATALYEEKQGLLLLGLYSPSCFNVIYARPYGMAVIS